MSERSRRFIAWLGSQPICTGNNCLHRVFRHHNHCGACGTKNPQFDPAEFRFERGMTIEEALTQCPTEHARALLDFQEDLATLMEYPHCFDCGAYILKPLTTQ